MHDAVMNEIKSCDIFIACAAVSDYKPERAENNKIKKAGHDRLQLNLVATVDIVSTVASQKDKPFIVGFAAETEQVVTYAKDKLQQKKLDMIAANQVGEKLGFATEDNELQVFWPQGSQTLPLAPKVQLARDLMTLIIEHYNAKNST